MTEHTSLAPLWRGAAFSIGQLMNGGAAEQANVKTQQQPILTPLSAK